MRKLFDKGPINVSDIKSLGGLATGLSIEALKNFNPSGVYESSDTLNNLDFNSVQGRAFVDKLLFTKYGIIQSFGKLFNRVAFSRVLAMSDTTLGLQKSGTDGEKVELVTTNSQVRCSISFFSIRLRFYNFQFISSPILSVSF